VSRKGKENRMVVERIEKVNDRMGGRGND